jgi:adenine-specific DNA-methyltransferase|tara:strand:- start:1133 stop:2386 length:1254 start_codon:yes stop_codon:yes gene_type:complete
MLSKDVTLHHLKKTAARDTDDYVFSQLIPYIGNKRKLLDIIHQAINMTEVDGGSFVDLFSGSTVVARFAKKLGFRVLANDWEPYSEQIAIGTIVNNKEPPFLQLGGCENVFRMLNDVKPIEGYITKHLCPEDDQNLNHEEDRLFFMRKNGMKIDAMRELISSWTNDEKISSEEFGYLMASLAYSVSYVSNTSGVFKGFHRGWGGSNGTAQYRICSDIELRPAILFDNGEKNISTREDAGKLVLELTNILGEIPDIIYLDPPYNQHPYGSNYHVLNTVTLWDKPDFPKKITRGTKSAIRLDWRTDRRSAYNSQRRAAQEFQELIDNITAKFILTSYSTEGNIPLEEMMRILGSKGSLRIVKREYVRYRVSPTRLSPKPRNVEFVVITDTNGKPESIESLEEIVSELHRIDSEIQIIQS